jgi:hypothetical protein
MNFFMRCGILAIVMLLGNISSARAQYYNVYNSPAVSPYLRLLQPGGFGVITYQGDVKPQLDAREAFQQQGQQINQLQQQTRSLETRSVRNTPLHQTGVGAHYLNYGHYYTGIREPRAR